MLIILEKYQDISMIEEIIYKKHMNLKLAADEMGIKWQTLYYRLKKQGVAVVGDKSKYGSDKDKLSAHAEEQFKLLVPKALDMNKLEFQSKVDFMIGSIKVDIKSAKPFFKDKVRSSALSWSFSTKKQSYECDFLCCFCFNEDMSIAKILLIPHEMFSGSQSLTASCKQSKWFDYEIEPNELAQFFEDMSCII